MSTEAPFVISQHPFAMAEILRRIRARETAGRIARRLGMSTKRFRLHLTHVAKLGPRETVESNLPLPHSSSSSSSSSK